MDNMLKPETTKKLFRWESIFDNSSNRDSRNTSFNSINCLTTKANLTHLDGQIIANNGDRIYPGTIRMSSTGAGYTRDAESPNLRPSSTNTQLLILM